MMSETIVVVGGGAAGMMAAIAAAVGLAPPVEMPMHSRPRCTRAGK